MLTSDASIKTTLFPGAGITDPQATAMFTDVNFGLNKIDNYIRWDPLTYEQDPVQYQSLVNELKYRFGLTLQQIEICREHFNKYTILGKRGALSGVPSLNHNQ